MIRTHIFAETFVRRGSHTHISKSNEESEVMLSGTETRSFGSFWLATFVSGFQFWFRSRAELTCVVFVREMSEISDENFEVKYRGNSIDISKFLLNHPGGVNTLEKYEGMSIDEKFKFYQHSNAAKYLLLDYKSRNEKVYDESYLEVKIERKKLSSLKLNTIMSHVSCFF